MTNPTTPTLAQAISTAGIARANCHRSGNREWHRIHSEQLDVYAGKLPSGSGIDNGTKITAAGARWIKLSLDYHNMDEHGCYDGWTTFHLTITSTFDGIDVDVQPNYTDQSEADLDRDEQTADYLAETFQYALTQPIETA